MPTRGTGTSKEALGVRLAALAAVAALALPAIAEGAAGDLDPSFDGDGRVNTGFGTTPFQGFDLATASVRSAAGQIYVVGKSPSQGGNFAVVRYTSGGVLDTTYGTGGIVSTDISGSGSEDHGNAVAIQTDGKIVVAGSTTGSGDQADFAVVRYLTTGALDTGFGGGDGIVTFDFPGGGEEDVANAVGVLASGNIVLAGRTDADPGENASYDFAVASLTSAGGLDSTFDGDGMATTDFGSTGDEAKALLATGSTFVAGGRTDPGGEGVGDAGDFALARYNGSSGALEGSFGTGGKQTVDFSGSTSAGDGAAALGMDSTGKLIAAGTAAAADFAVARMDGMTAAPDNTFDSDGEQTVSTPASGTTSSSLDSGLAVAVQADNAVVLGGREVTNIDGKMVLARVLSTGAVDTAGFGTNGVVVTDFYPGGDTDEEVTGLHVDEAASRIIATGTINHNLGAVRYLKADGSVDNTFGPDGNGKVETNVLSPIPSSETARDIVLQPDGKAVVVGPTNVGPIDQFSGDMEFGIARYNADGSLDPTFGAGGIDGNGRASTNFDMFPNTSGTQDFPAAVALQSDGKIVVAGDTDPTTSDNGDFAVARYEPDGDLDTTFHGDGLVTTNFGGTDRDVATDVAVTGTPGSPGFRIVVAGDRRSGFANEDFAVAVYEEDGDPDNTFDTDGMQTTDIDFGDNALAVGVQADDKVVVAGLSGTGTPAPTSSDFALVRYTAGGAPDTTSFGAGDGEVTTDFEATFDGALDMTIEELGGGDVRILLAGRTSFGGGAQGGIAAYSTDGSLDTSFSPGGGEGDGKARYTLSAPTNTGLRALDLQADGKIVASGAVEAPDFGAIRATSAGDLDLSFGGDGRVSTSFAAPTTGQTTADGLQVLPDQRLIVAGGALSPFNGSDFLVARYLADAPPGGGGGGTVPGTSTPVTTPAPPTPTTAPAKKKCKKAKKGAVATKKKCKRKGRR